MTKIVTLIAGILPTVLARLLLRFWGLFPQSLPIGLAAFDTYFDQICFAYGFPSLPGYRQAVATMIMHQGPTTWRVPPRVFVAALRKAQANEVAYQVVQDLKVKDAEEKAKLAATKALEAESPSGAESFSH